MNLVLHGFGHAGRAVLRWEFDDLDHAVETLTTAAGGLRVLRVQLEELGRVKQLPVSCFQRLLNCCSSMTQTF